MNLTVHDHKWAYRVTAQLARFREKLPSGESTKIEMQEEKLQWTLYFYLHYHRISE